MERIGKETFQREKKDSERTRKRSHCRELVFKIMVEGNFQIYLQYVHSIRSSCMDHTDWTGWLEKSKMLRNSELC